MNNEQRKVPSSSSDPSAARPLVALVGRPNVGKSTLFNRIVGRRMAVVHEEPGTTRDRLYSDTIWNDVPFTIVDTGGVEALGERLSQATGGGGEALAQDSPSYPPMIRAQAEAAIREADAIIFVTDAADGLTPGDEEVANILRRAECPLFVAANKADNARLRQEALEFYALGFDDVYPLSALHGIGVADLLDDVVEALREGAPSPGAGAEGERPQAALGRARLAIVGRPNVGKSSLLNRLLGEDRVIVSPIPGTTRDAIDTYLVWEGTPITLIDTAGIRRRGKVAGVEYYSVLRALRAIRRADVALLVIDGVEGVRAQDKHVAGFVLDEWASVVVLVNKWDAVDKDAVVSKAAGTSQQPNAMKTYEEWVRHALRFLDYVPVLFISALTGRGVDRVLPTALTVREARFRRVTTGKLNRLVQDALTRHAPPSKGGRRLKIYYASQPEVDPPTFVFHVNDPDLVHFSYERYLENRLREAYDFPGTPLRLLFRPRRRR